MQQHESEIVDITCILPSRPPTCVRELARLGIGYFYPSGFMTPNMSKSPKAREQRETLETILLHVSGYSVT